jgi:hypothetical protein
MRYFFRSRLEEFSWLVIGFSIGVLCVTLPVKRESKIHLPEHHWELPVQETQDWFERTIITKDGKRLTLI